MIAKLGRKITISDLHRYAGNFIEVLEMQGISSVDDLRAKIPESVRVNQIVNDRIVFEMGSSKLGTSAYIMAYVIFGIGVPIEGRINTAPNYVEIKVKAQSSIEGYEAWGSDSYRNILQSKSLKNPDIAAVVEELERLKTV